MHWRTASASENRLTPRAVPFSYRQTLSNQESEYTVNATFDAHESFANFATNQWRNARTGFFRAMTVVLIVSLIFYFFVRAAYSKYLERRKRFCKRSDPAFKLAEQFIRFKLKE